MTYTGDVNALLKRLDDAGGIGADLSPGDPLARDAADAIRDLLTEIENIYQDLAGASL